MIMFVGKFQVNAMEISLIELIVIEHWNRDWLSKFQAYSEIGILFGLGNFK